MSSRISNPEIIFIFLNIHPKYVKKMLWIEYAGKYFQIQN